MDCLVPSAYGEAEYTEKRSRFIGQVWPVASEEEARYLITQTKSKYHDARHNCWCYILHEGSVIRYADDGEPQGTAGQPILEVFRRGGIGSVLCVVTRYFGGILLGAGGLTRAYAHTAKLALDAAGVSELRSQAILEIICPYSMFERVRNEIEQCGGVLENTEYAADVTISAVLDKRMAPEITARMTDMTAGTVTVRITGSKYAVMKNNNPAPGILDLK